MTKVEDEAPASEKSNDKVLERKWGKDAIATGYTVLPSALLQAQSRLGISAMQLAVLVHLIEHWWSPHTMPFPKKEVIAERLSVSLKTVQRACVALEDANLLKRIDRYSGGRRTSNEYDLEPLAKRVREIAKEIADADAQAGKTRRAARRPKWKSSQEASK